MGPDIINVSWNDEEYMRKGVHQIRVVAESLLEPKTAIFAIVNTSDSKCSLMNGIEPSTIYRVYIEEMSEPRELHEVHYVATSEGSELASP